MELVIVTSSVGTLILLATHVIDFGVESALRPIHGNTPDDESQEVPLPFEGTAQYDQAA